MEISLKDEIVILDEAHNIEDSAREGGSESFTDDQLDKAIKEIHEMSKLTLCLDFHSFCCFLSKVYSFWHPSFWLQTCLFI